MKQYIGTKIIHAEKQLHENKDGYKVVYEDGYTSWSPKDVFEKSYWQTDGMNFGLALEALKMGKKVARNGWNGKEQFIELATNISYVNPMGNISNVNHKQMGNKAIAFVGTSGVQLGWLASQADMLSEDWKIID